VAAGIVMLAAWIAIGMKFPLSPVHVDNYTGTAVALELDGKPWLKLPADSSRQVFLRDGAYQVTVRAEPGGGVLGSHDAAVAGRSTYVLNVLGRMSYREGTREYRKVPLPPMLAHNPPETTIDQVWFNTDADFIFEEPPESISVSGSGDVATRSYLRRAGKAKPPAASPAPPTPKPAGPAAPGE
jgi:hypothetical protein